MRLGGDFVSGVFGPALPRLPAEPEQEEAGDEPQPAADPKCLAGVELDALWIGAGVVDLELLAGDEAACPAAVGEVAGDADGLAGAGGELDPCAVLLGLGQLVDGCDGGEGFFGVEQYGECPD